MRAQNNLTDQIPGHGTTPELKRSSGGLYLATWAVLATVSAGYMAVLLLQPDWATPLTTQSLRSDEPPPASSQVVEQLSGEVDTLRKTIADLQRELTEVKATAAVKQEKQTTVELPYEPPIQLSQRETTGVGPGILVEAPQLRPSQAEIQTVRAEPAQAKAGDALKPEAKQVAAATPKPAQPEEVVRTKAAKPEPAPSPVVRTVREEPKPAVTPPPPTPLKKVFVLNANPAERPDGDGPRLETGSLPPAEPPMITFGPPTVTPANEAVAIHLDAAPSLEALRLRWDVLHERHRSALKDLQPRYLISGTAESPSYLLMAGPIASSDEAGRICALLRARRVACSVGGPFVGQAL